MSAHRWAVRFTVVEVASSDSVPAVGGVMNCAWPTVGRLLRRAHRRVPDRGDSPRFRAVGAVAGRCPLAGSLAAGAVAIATWRPRSWGNGALSDSAPAALEVMGLRLADHQVAGFDVPAVAYRFDLAHPGWNGRRGHRTPPFDGLAAQCPIRAGRHASRRRRRSSRRGVRAHRPQPTVRRALHTHAIYINTLREVNGDPGGVLTLDNENFEPARPLPDAVRG